MLASNQLYSPSDASENCSLLKATSPEAPQRSRFSKEEDYLLKVLVSSQTQPKWSEIATHFQNRTARQCRERYNNYLRPELVNGPWTKEEDELLLELFEKHGPKWSLISQSFNSRSAVNVKNHHSSLINQSSLKRAKSTTNNFEIELLKESNKLNEIPAKPVKSFNVNIFMIENNQIAPEPVQTFVQNEIFTETKEIVTDPIQPFNENEIVLDDESETFLNDECFQNMLSNFNIEEEMWSTNLPSIQEDDLFAF